MFKFFLLLYYLPMILAQQSLFDLKDTIKLSNLSRPDSCTSNQSLINSICQCKENFTLSNNVEQSSSQNYKSLCQCKENYEFDSRQNTCFCPVSFTYSRVQKKCDCKGGSIVWNSELGHKVCLRSRLWIVFSFGIFVVIVLKSVSFWKHCHKPEKNRNFKTLYQRMSGNKNSFEQDSTINTEIEMSDWINSVERKIPD